MDVSKVADLMNYNSAPEENLADELARLRGENAELKQLVLNLEKAADTDPLLPVYNRRAFIREIDRARTVMGRYDILSSLIYFDLNGFKAINDRFGHNVGDEVLQKVAQVLVSGVRECDLVARLGGDEFGVLLFKTDKNIARAKASALAVRITAQEIILPTGKVSTSAAWGVAPCETEDTAEQILARADRAMYLAKRKIA